MKKVVIAVLAVPVIAVAGVFGAAAFQVATADDAMRVACADALPFTQTEGAKFGTTALPGGETAATFWKGTPGQPNYMIVGACTFTGKDVTYVNYHRHGKYIGHPA